MKNKKTLKMLIALCAALIVFSGCGDIDETADDSSTAETSTAETTESVSIKVDLSVDEDGKSTVADDSGESDDTESDDTESDSESSESEADTADDTADYTLYTNSEFGFTLPLPIGTEYYENEDVLKETSDDAEIQFRSLMDTVSTDTFNMAVQLYETEKTLDDLAQSRQDYVDSVNDNETNDTMSIAESQTEEISGKSTLFVSEMLESDNGLFYTLRVYYQISDTQYIYVQGNCYAEETLAELKGCAEEMKFTENN